MSKVVKFFASLVLVASLFAFAPSNAEARWGGGWHGGGWNGAGWHGGGWGWRGGWGGWRGGGWGWGGPAFAVGFAPAFAWGVGPGWGWGAGPGWGNPYWYASSGARCGWVPVRVWRFGRPVVRSVWRCW